VYQVGIIKGITLTWFVYIPLNTYHSTINVDNTEIIEC